MSASVGVIAPAASRNSGQPVLSKSGRVETSPGVRSTQPIFHFGAIVGYFYRRAVPAKRSGGVS